MVLTYEIACLYWITKSLLALTTQFIQVLTFSPRYASRSTFRPWREIRRCRHSLIQPSCSVWLHFSFSLFIESEIHRSSIHINLIQNFILSKLREFKVRDKPAFWRRKWVTLFWRTLRWVKNKLGFVVECKRDVDSLLTLDKNYYFFPETQACISLHRKDTGSIN